MVGSVRVGAVLGAAGVAIGAFGAHAWKAALEAAHTRDVFETAVHYHLLHAAVLLVVDAVTRPGRARSVARAAMASGVVVFSGSLYVLALSGQKWLGAITPLGGIAFIVGWVALAVGAKRATDGQGASG